MKGRVTIKKTGRGLYGCRTDEEPIAVVPGLVPGTPVRGALTSYPSLRPGFAVGYAGQGPSDEAMDFQPSLRAIVVLRTAMPPRNDGERPSLLQFSNSPTASADLQTHVIAPCSLRPQDLPVFPLHSVSRKGRAERLGENRARGARIFIRASRMLFRTRAVVQPIAGLNRATDEFFASVPHAAVLSAYNSPRHHVLGALTECLVSPHCWVLGPPTPSAGRRPFTTLRGLPQPA